MEQSLSPWHSQEQSLTAALQTVAARAQRFGLILDEAQIAALVQRRGEVLRDTGRVEFGPGAVPALVEAFCDSPYLQTQDCDEILAELIESFYYFKGEALEALSDDELIAHMRRYFDDVCHGSVELLSGTLLEDLCRDIRCGGLPGDEPPDHLF